MHEQTQSIYLSLAKLNRSISRKFISTYNWYVCFYKEQITTQRKTAETKINWRILRRMCLKSFKVLRLAMTSAVRTKINVIRRRTFFLCFCTVWWSGSGLTDKTNSIGYRDLLQCMYAGTNTYFQGCNVWSCHQNISVNILADVQLYIHTHIQ